MIKFSLCISSYKQQPFLLERCIQSILSQSFNNYEILICQQADDDLSYIQTKYHEVKIVKQSKASLSLSRITLYNASTGEFVWFIDADDYLYSSTVIAELTKFISNQNTLSDMYLVNIVRKIGENYFYQDNEKIYAALRNSSSLINLLLSTHQMNSLCCKIVRSSIVIDENIPSIFQGEDKYLSLVFARRIKSITGLNLNAYCYEDNNESGTHVFNSQQIFDIAHVIWYIETYFSNYPIRVKGYAQTLSTIGGILSNGFEQKKLTKKLFHQIFSDTCVSEMMTVFRDNKQSLLANYSRQGKIIYMRCLLNQNYFLFKALSKAYIFIRKMIRKH